MAKATLAQQIAGGIAKVLSVISIILVSIYATKRDKSEKWLGGLHRQPHEYQDCAWHAILMTVGMGFCLCNAIITYRLLPFGHLVSKGAHSILNLAGLVCCIIGIQRIAYFKDQDPPMPHLTSLHSWIGLGALTLYFQNYVLGFLHFWAPLFDERLKKMYLPNHKFLGFMTYAFATINMEIGITQKHNTMGCMYAISKVDNNPAEHYEDLQDGCRLSSGLGLILLTQLLLVGYCIWEFNVSDEPIGDGEAAGLSKQEIMPKAEA